MPQNLFQKHQLQNLFQMQVLQNLFPVKRQKKLIWAIGFSKAAYRVLILQIRLLVTKPPWMHSSSINKSLGHISKAIIISKPKRWHSQKFQHKM